MGLFLSVGKSPTLMSFERNRKINQGGIRDMNTNTVIKSKVPYIFKAFVMQDNEGTLFCLSQELIYTTPDFASSRAMYNFHSEWGKKNTVPFDVTAVTSSELLFKTLADLGCTVVKRLPIHHQAVSDEKLKAMFDGFCLAYNYCKQEEQNRKTRSYINSVEYIYMNDLPSELLDELEEIGVD